MKRLSALCSLLLVLVMVAGFAAIGTASSGDLTPLTKYEEPVTITVGREINAGGQFAEGQNSEDNGWTQLLRDELNIIIDVKNGFEAIGAEYNKTLALHIASDTLPDTFAIQNNSAGMTMFKQLLEGNKLADLTEVYHNAIGGKSKEYLDALDTEVLLQYMTVDGKIYGITGGKEGYNTALLWIRKDWLDACGLEIPGTLEEIANVAKTFVEQKPGGKDNTIGIAVNPDTSGNGGIFGQWMGILPVFNAVGSYPDIWLEDESGQVVYGAIQPETKEALGILADWYQSGVLDKNMVTMKNGDEVRDTYISTNACGMIFNAWWDPWVQWDGYQDASVKNDEGIEWVPVMAPLNSNGKYSPKNESVEPGGQVILASYEHPEAVVKAMNLLDEVNIFRNPDYEPQRAKYIEPILGVSDKRSCGPFPNSLVATQNRIVAADNINDYKASGELNLDPRIEGDRDYVLGAYDFINNNTMAEWYQTKNEEDINTYMFQYVGHWAYDVVGNLYADAEKSGVYEEKYRAFDGATDSDEDYGAMLMDLRNTAFVQIISGEKPLDYFDEFVVQWKKLGGDIITAEVNAAVSRK